MTVAFRYRAMDRRGRYEHGVLEAPSRRLAYERLRLQGLSPLDVRIAGAGAASRSVQSLSKRALTDFLAELGELVAGGVPFRQALGVLGESGQDRGAVLARAIDKELSAGHALDGALDRALGPEGGLLAALAAAGEASGDLGGALIQGASTLRQELEVSDALAAALAYPVFILVMTTATLLVILTLVVPALRPLADQQEQALPLALAALFALSDLLIAGRAWIVGAGLALPLAAIVAWRLGWLRPLAERLLLDGPLRRLVRPIVFGRVAAVAGALLEARVNASDAFRLAAAGTSIKRLRDRTGEMIEAVREGAAVSTALADCLGAPVGLARLARIGEETGTLGVMLVRGGALERDRALRRLKALSAVLGPTMIVLLGLFIGLVFAGLLSGVGGLGMVE